MRITCPSCEAAYEVPAHLLAPTRRLKCAQCGTEWLPAAPVATPAAAPVAVAPAPPAEPPPAPPEKPVRATAAAAPAPAPEPEPASATIGELRERVVAAERNEPPRKPRVPALLVTAWAATFLLLATGFWGAYAFRDKVMHAWPPSQRAYAALGLDAEVK